MRGAGRPEVLRRTGELVRRLAPGPVVVTETTKLVADLGLESVQILELVVAVEQAFAIEFDEGEIRPIETVGDLVDAIAERLGPEPAPGDPSAP